MIHRILSLVALVLIGLCSVSFAQTPSNDGRDADRAAIRASIETIFQGFIDKDPNKLRETHAKDWKGFIDGSPVVLKGRDRYMAQYEGIENRKGSGMIAYKITEWDVTFEGPAAIVCFNAEITSKSGDTVTTRKTQIMDIYGKRDGIWVQIATDTNAHPETVAKRQQQPNPISSQMRTWILEEREKVWRAFFANDKAMLDKLIPEDLIVMEGGDEGFKNRERILAESKQFAESGAKLISLEFPKTEIQMYGSTVLIYTTYQMELDFGGQRSKSSGRATENFVIRNDQLVNVGWHLGSNK